MDNYAVEKIKQKFDFTNDEDILALYTMIQSGEIKLDGAAGRALDDEIYELAMEAKKRKKLGDSSLENRDRKQEKRTAVIKQKENDKTNKQEIKPGKKRRGEKTKVVVLTKKELRFRRWMTALLSGIAIVCFGYFGFYCYEAYQIRIENEKMAALKENDTVNAMFSKQEVKHTSQDGQTQVLTVLDEYKTLYNQNKNLIGWLRIADIDNEKEKPVIDYPVLQTSMENPNYYLDHNFDQQEDKNGALFLDAACDVVKPSTNLIVYGHNMRSGKMFGNLSKYKSVSFYKKHPIIEFDSIYEKGIYQVMYVFRSHIYQEAEIAFKYYQFIDAASEKEFQSNMDEMANMSLYDTGVSAHYGDQLLTLSTCDYEEKNGRFVVVAKRIEE